MVSRSFLSGWTLTLGALATAAAVSTGTVLATNSEAVLRNSFSMALNTLPSANQQAAKSAPISGSEEYWLTADRSGGSLPVTKAISVGDRIDLTLGGLDRQLEVASVSEYAPLATEIDTRSSKSRYILVMAREAGNKDARTVRFIMEVDSKSAPAIGTQARAL